MENILPYEVACLIARGKYVKSAENKSSNVNYKLITHE